MDICITSITHPPYFIFLKDHLLSMKEAVIRHPEVRCYLLASGLDEGARKDLRSIIDKNGFAQLTLIEEKERYTIGEARNRLFQETHNEWVLFTDCDTILDRNYIHNMKSFFNQKKFENVGAVAGSIGIAKNATKFGYFEGLMDIVALNGKIKKIDKSIFDNILTDTGASQEAEECERNLYNASLSFSGSEIGYLQGFNQVIHRDIYTKTGGFDERFISAEDRDMAANVWRSNKRVIFAPECKIYHIYNFPLKHILRRKYIHGIWSARFREKYKQHSSIVPQYGFNKWMKYFLTCFAPKAPFNISVNSRIYFISAFLSYAYGCFIGSIYKLKESSAKNV